MTNINIKKAEIANYITHGIGFLFYCIASYLLFEKGCVYNNYILNFSLIVYIISQLLIFFSSTLYHVVSQPKVKRILRYADHISIYVSIAGCYTPILLWVIGGTTGKVFFLILWSLVLLGVVYKIFFLGKYPKFSLGLYLGMGWIAVFLAKQIFDAFSATCLWLLLGEGLSYTLGTYFFWKDDKYTYYHSIWHLFVYAGSLFHYLLLWFLL
jgi:hemolysin III